MADPENDKFGLCLVCNRGESVSETSGHDEMMIQCDVCSYWFHVSCVNLEEVDVVDIDQYHCPKCEINCGCSILRKNRNSHRHDSSDAEASNKNTECGTRDFISDLKRRSFSKFNEVVQVLSDGYSLTYKWLDNHGFKSPVLVLSTNGLDLMLPSPMKVQDIENLVGTDTLVDVLDSRRRQNIKMTLGRFFLFFSNPNGSRVFSLLRLNLKNIGLSDVIEEPSIVREISWLRQNWAFKLSALDCVLDHDEFYEFLSQAPDMSKWLSLTMTDSYTDFSINRCGTSMWCTMLWGENLYFLIEPTPMNLEAYENWRKSPDFNERFFADVVNCCYECPVKAGQVLFIPSGWIYAVLTISDSLVFGGNFLHSFAIEMQLRIFEIEQRLGLTGVDQFSNFRLLHWFASRYYVDFMQELIDDGSEAQTYLVTGLTYLKNALQSWLRNDPEEDDTESISIPENFSIDSMNRQKIVTKLGRLLQKYQALMNKVKGRGESKAKSHRSGKTRRPKKSLEQKIPKNKSKVPRMLHDAVVTNEASNDQQPVEGNNDLILAEVGPPVDASSSNAPVCDSESVKSTAAVLNNDSISNSTAAGILKPDTDHPIPRSIVGFSLLDIQKSLQSNSNAESNSCGGGSCVSNLGAGDFTAQNKRAKRQKRCSEPSNMAATSGDDVAINLSSMFSVSKHGRLPKVNVKALGKTEASLQYVKEFGVCREDDEFIYPSLNDSDCDAPTSGLREKFSSDPIPVSPRHEPFDALLRKTLEHVHQQNSKISHRPLHSIKCKKGKATAKQRLASKLRIQKFI